MSFRKNRGYLMKKKVIKILISILLLLSMVSCKSVNNNIDFQNYAENEIPFSYGFNGYMPLFTFYAKTPDDEIVKLQLEFDSGLDVNMFSKRAIKKLFPKYRFSEPETYTIKQIVLETENKFKISDIQFKYRKDQFKTTYAGLYYDGAIGLSFFKKFGKVTFDMPNQKVIVGDYEMDSNPIQMREINILDNIFYEIPVLINGKEDTAIIDFGTKGFGVLRDDFGEGKIVLSDEDYLKPFDKSLLEWNSYIKIDSLQVGEVVVENVKCYNGKARFINLPDIVKNLAFYHNTVGMEFFKDKVVQFDFENMLFYVK